MHQLLLRNEINDEKWNKCVQASSNALIYGLTWYLDAATEQQWDGIVWGDYNAVLPIPYNKKTILKQVYMPSSIRCLEVFSPLETFNASEEVIQKYLSKYFNVDYSFLGFVNIANIKTYQVLKLNESYDVLKKAYRSDRKKDLRKAIDVEVVPIGLDEYHQTRKVLLANIEHYTVKGFFNEYEAVNSNNCFEGYKATIDGESISVIGLLKKFNHLYILSSATGKKGYDFRAFVKLVDFVIETYASSGYTINFMGSSMDGIRKFNKSFGAIDVEYSSYVKHNPFYKLLKKL